MGKTTSGQSTSENYPDWATIYNEFFKMYNNKTGTIPFRLTELYNQVTSKQQPDPVAKALISLEKYYDMIESFLEDVGSPRTERQDLVNMVDYLCRDDTLDGYPDTVNTILDALASIAGKAATYVSSIRSSGSQLSGEESRVLMNLMTTIKSISDNVARDFAAEIGRNWAAYVSARRRSLSAIARI